MSTTGTTGTTGGPSATPPGDGADERLIRAIGELAQGEVPPPGWQAEVMAKLDVTERPWWQRWVAWTSVGAAVATLVVVAIVIRRDPPRGAGGPGDGTTTIATQRVLQGDVILRGDDAHVGDTLQVQVQPGPAPHVELHVWRTADNALVARCAGGGANGVEPCRVRSAALVLDVKLAEAGRHRAVVITSAGPLPAGDAAALLEAVAGDAAVKVRWLEPIDVP